jgi:hypothetical protein
MAATFITSAERIEMTYWVDGLLGSYSAIADQTSLCNGEKSCL